MASPLPPLHAQVHRHVLHLLRLAKLPLSLTDEHSRQLLIAARRNYASHYLQPAPPPPPPLRHLLPSHALSVSEVWLRSLPAQLCHVEKLILVVNATSDSTNHLLTLANSHAHSHLQRHTTTLLHTHIPFHFDQQTLNTCLTYLPQACLTSSQPHHPPHPWPAIALAYALLHLRYDRQPPDIWYSSLLQSLEAAWSHPHHSQLMLLLPFITITSAPPVHHLAQMFTALRCGHAFSVFTVLHLTHQLAVENLSDHEKHTLVASALPFPTFPFQNLIQLLSQPTHP